MITKTRGSRRGKVRAKFSLRSADAKSVHIAGDFSDWRPQRAMRRGRDGTWEATLELDSGTTYQFRYLVDGREWVNDPAADAYAPNPFGSENSVLVT